MPPPATEPLTLTIREAAQLLGINKRTAYLEAKTGMLAGVNVIRVGRRVLVPREPLMRVLNDQSQLMPEAAGDCE